ncbi:leucine rich repeat domain protein [Aspergillus luchuensis]|uniref:Leucine rich repeat domain protein n=1 Tax=Aspergillus kawachii TaxID=1069201 RepID=A0A146EYH6_ASPKA|nr:leucine rich repeat domain protein [Aspergillus luchuensis]
MVVSPSPGRRSQGLSQWSPVSYGRIRTWTDPEPKGCYQTIDDDLMQGVVIAPKKLRVIQSFSQPIAARAPRWRIQTFEAGEDHDVGGWDVEMNWQHDRPLGSHMASSRLAVAE